MRGMLRGMVGGMLRGMVKGKYARSLICDSDTAIAVLENK